MGAQNHVAQAKPQNWENVLWGMGVAFWISQIIERRMGSEPLFYIAIGCFVAGGAVRLLRGSRKDPSTQI